MTAEDLETLKERYDTLRDAYVKANQAVEDARGEVGPLGPGPVPTISQAWIDAVDEEQRIEPEYIAARDAYWTAVRDQQGR